MKNYSTAFVAVIIALFVCSCTQPQNLNEDEQTNNSLNRTWVRTGHEDGYTILKNSDSLDGNEYGFIIYPDGKFTERKNSGWCGTPPIAYSNFEGEWKNLSDSLLEINVGYWGGAVSYQMEIVSVSSDVLRIQYHYDN